MMPTSPLAVCSEPGCPVRVPRGRCPAHARVSASRNAQRPGGRPWRRVREYVLERDGYRCRIRGPRCTGIATTVDHVVPVSRGGSDDPANLRAACALDNYSDGARLARQGVTGIHPSRLPTGGHRKAAMKTWLYSRMKQVEDPDYDGH